jgi:hypothetical protein
VLTNSNSNKGIFLIETEGIICIEYYGFFVLGIFKSSIPPKKTLQSLSSMDNLLIHRIFFYQNNLLAEWLYVVVQYKFVED